MTLLLINLDKTTTFNVNLSLNEIQMVRGGSRTREEYHLTAKDGNLHSQTMVLNGKDLILNPEGEIPPLEPLYVGSLKPIVVAPYSIVFAHIPYLTLNACSNLVMEF